MNYLNSFKTTLLTLVIFSLISSLCVHTSFGEDADSDQIPDVIDNCPTHYNPAQADTYPPQRNGIGDTCDCEANFDCDTDVDASDVTIFLADFGRSQYFRPCSNQEPCNGDFQCDQDVDAADVTKFLEDFGRSQYYNPCPICPGKPWCVYCTDSDEDGFTSEGGACGPVDCDEGDDSIYPGATEICEDTIDQDCDGEDLLCILVDQDGDLWASSQGDCCDTGGETSLGCSLETRGEIFPGATDFPGDGIDQDCDGVDDPVPGQEDFDHDGLSFAAGDCNDRIPTVHPGATEILCNDIDEDCNGSDSCGITPTEESYSGYITGEVFNTTTFEPLPGAKVLVQGQGELTTDAQGKFAFPVPDTRFYRVTVTKSGYTYAQRIIHVERYHAFAIDPIYLTPLDTATTEIGAGGGIHESSTGEIKIEFPSGALTQQITVSATRYRFGDALPSPLPETSHFTTAVELLPDELTFETPVRVLIENSYNLAPGTLVPVGYYRKDLNLWIPDGMGIITPDGQYMEYWTKHFSSIDFNYPAKAPGGSNPPDGTNETPGKDACQDGLSGQSKIVFKTGELMEDYYLPSFKVLGTTISPRLVYRSLAADPKAFITTRYHLDSQETTIPETTEFTLKIAGTKKTTYFAGSDGDLKQSYLFDGIDYKGDRLPTGIYPYEIVLANWYPTYFYGAHYFGWAGGGLIVPPIRAVENERLAKSFTGRLPFENLEESPFGAGWSLAGIPKIHIGIGEVLMSDGSGGLKVFTSSIINTVAGTGVAGYNGDEIPAIQARLKLPRDVEADSFGNLYIADANNYRIRKVDTNGIITTVAGNGISGWGNGNGGLATDASIRPHSVTVDSFGNFYFLENRLIYSYLYSGLVRKVDTNGIITTVAGGSSDYDDPGDGGPATQAMLHDPSDIAVDSKGNIYISTRGYYDSYHLIRKVDTNGIITTIAGRNTKGCGGTPAKYAYLDQPSGITFDSEGNLYIAEYGCCAVRKIDTDGNITKVVGKGQGYCVDSGDGGPATNAGIRPLDVAVDAVGNLYIGTQSDKIRKVDLAGIITTFAGGGNPPDGLGDGGLAIDASLDSAEGISVDSFGNLYCDGWNNHRIRTVFMGTAASQYKSPEGDYSTLVRNTNGTFTHTLKDGTVNQFNVQGYLTSTTDLNDNTTSYTYTEGKLTTITYPTGQVTSLHYTDGLLDYIEDPALRRTYFVHDGNGDLRSITDPETHALSFEYTGNHLLHKKTDRNNNVTWYNYDSNGLIEQVVAERDGDDEITSYEPGDAQGLINDLPPGKGTALNPADPVFIQDATYTDPKGYTYTIETDKYGKALKTTDPLGNVTEYERGCDCGGITKITKPNGAEITMTYDDKGNLLSRTEEIDEETSATWSYQYHPTLNKVTKIIDPENNDTAFTYDGDGNLLKITDALDNETVYTYDSSGLLLTVTDALDHSSTNTYDTVGNLETASDNSGNVTSYEYDTAGNVTEITRGTGTAEEEVTTYTYDDMNRLLTVTDELNNTTTYTYDGNGNMLTVTDAENNLTINVYDEANRRTRITDAENNQTDFGYDLNGNLTSVTDANLHTTTYTYDQLKRLTQKTYHDVKTFTYTYDEVGNKITETDPNEHTITFDYDWLNRLTAKTYPDESTETYTYDKVSRMLTGINADSSLTYVYDELGRIESATLNGKTIGYGYDDVGNRTTLTTPESAIVEYSYNSGNLMTRMQLASNSKGIDYTYDALHRVIRKDYTGGSYSTYVFDDAGRLENIQHKRSDESVIYTQSNTPDNVGNITSKITGLGTTTYGYDEIYQLTAADHPAPSNETFTYDGVGNRLTSADYTDWDYNTRNQLTGYNGVTYTYDNNGNTISKTDAGGTANYTYNYDNRLTRIDLAGGGYVTYKYDVKGRRIEKNVNGTITKYLYDGDSLLAEYNGSGILQRNYFYGSGDINPSILFENSTVYFYHHDHLNTPQAVTNESGTIVWDGVYKSFGEVSITTGTVTNNFRFPGQYYDAESGLHYNYFRYYDSSTGRYLREDPIGLKNGMNHLYVYVQNNPINWIDPFGLDCGPGQVGDFIFPDFWFKKACREHDVCYRDCCAKKEDCDDEFCKKLNDRCRQMKLWNPLRYTCFAAAQSYCNAPKTPIGTWRFNDAQKKCE